MKSAFYIIRFVIAIVLFSLYGCQNLNDEDLNSYLPKRNEIEIRTVEQAITIAKLVNPNSMQSRSESNSAYDVTIISSYRGRTDGLDTLLYIVNYGDDDGFAIISAPNCVEPVLAFVENGRFDSEETSSNSSFIYALDCAQSYVETKAFEVSNNPTIKPIYRSDTIWDVFKSGPRVSVKWGQRWPENSYAPNKLAGCGPVAIAQFLSYFKTPTSIDLTFDDKDVDSILINWDELIEHVQSTNYIEPTAQQRASHILNCGASINSHTTIGRLLREIGQISNSQYLNKPTTSTTVSNVFGTLKSFLPNRPTYQAYNRNGLYDRLKQGGIALVYGRTSNDEGHFWVADGTLRYGYEVYEYTLNQETDEYELKNTTQVEANNYLHFNWGWAGNSNGFFLEGIFDNDERAFTDEEAPSFLPRSRYDFSPIIYYLHIR
ncbi:MAG: C10 family peptidase [Muribaculaceae bacterium]